ncbi:MAG: hypothetical protein ACRD2E_14765 [Terriglobales bacterium]
MATGSKTHIVAAPSGPRTEFNPFQTFAYGPYVATVVDAHFDPYAEGLLRPGRTKADMETVPRLRIAGGAERD